jgi:hypothetical protein
MVTRELLQAEIAKLNDTQLEEVYTLLQRYVESKTASQKSSFLADLSQIKIQAPPDFSTNWEQYASGEKEP